MRGSALQLVLDNQPSHPSIHDGFLAGKDLTRGAAAAVQHLMMGMHKRQGLVPVRAKPRGGDGGSVPNSGRRLVYSIWSVSRRHLAMDIHSAAASGVLAVVRARVEAEPSAVHSEDVDRTRPLTYEAVEGQRHIVEYLLDNGAEIDHRNKSGWTAFYLACSVGQDEVVELLISRGADPTIPDGGSAEPLDVAAMNGHTGVVMQLLRDGRSNIDQADMLGDRPLHCAAFCDEPHVVAMLLEAGADPCLPDERCDDALGSAVLAFRRRGYDDAPLHILEAWHVRYLLHKARSLRDAVLRIEDTPTPTGARTRRQLALGRSVVAPVYLRRRVEEGLLLLPEVEVGGGGGRRGVKRAGGGGGEGEEEGGLRRLVVRHVVEGVKPELVVEPRELLG